MTTKFKGKLLAENLLTDGVISKGVSIASPVLSDEVTLLVASKDELAMSRLALVVRGTSPSVAWTLKRGADRSAAGTTMATGTATNATAGTVVATFTDRDVPVDEHLWLEVGTVSGTVDEFAITAYLKSPEL